MAVKGVDISEFNGGVNFDAVKAAGAEFVILRTGLGSDYPGQQDKNFGVYVTACEKAGIPYGVYHYGYAKNRQGGIDEAKHCLRLLNGRKPLYGVWYDMEDNSTLGGDLLGAAQGFCDTIEAAGLYAGVYASLNWWNNYLTAPGFNQYDRWVAQYYSECQYKGEYGIWQYTDAWVIGGKKFDGNYAYKDYPAIVKAMSGETEEEDDEMSTYEKWKEYQSRYEQEQAKKPVSGWADDIVKRVKAEGIMKGDTDGKFRAQSDITREETAATLLNLLDSEALKNKIVEVIKEQANS